MRGPILSVLPMLVFDSRFCEVSETTRGDGVGSTRWPLSTPAQTGHHRAVVSQAAEALLEVTPIPDDPARVDVRLRLRCGCVVQRQIAADRILDRPDGTRFAVGKYPCPASHPAS